MKNFWKKYYKWVGLFFSFFILMFCFFGIVFNYCIFFLKVEVSRNWMLESYYYKNWNNGIIKGILCLFDGKILVYGNVGVWKIDFCFVIFVDFNWGLVEGIDNCKISNIVCVVNNDIWCVGLYFIYFLNYDSWKEYLIVGNDEWILDII